MVVSVYSHFKSDKVCSLPNITLFQKSIWFIDNNILVILKISQQTVIY